MDSQLAFFLVRPAKAMGRKRADPDTVVAGYSNAPNDHTSDISFCKMDLFHPRNVGMGKSPPWRLWFMAWAGQDHSRDASGKGQRKVSALGSLGLAPP